MTRGRFLLLLALAAGLWLLQRLSAAYGVMAGSLLGRAVDLAANSAVAAVVVVALGWIAIELGLAIVLRVRPSGVHRIVAYGLLALAGISWVFANFGVDVTAVIATSAVFAAALGLALQPTLGGVIAGLVMHNDVRVRLGDAIEIDGGLLRVTGLGWRSVTAEVGDGKRLVIPNAAIVDQTVHVYSGTAPARFDTEFPAPLTIAQERVERLVMDMIGDVPGINLSRPAAVMPMAFDMRQGHGRYRVRYWVSDIFNKTTIEADILSRIWHTFQREQIPWPVSNWFDPALRDWSAVPGDQGDGELLFAPGEPLLFPERCAGQTCVVKRGELQPTSPVERLASGIGSRERPRGPLSREAALRQISQRLANDIGPYAELAVSEAARSTANIGAIIDRVASEIDDETARAAFIADLPAEIVAPPGPGFSFAPTRDSGGRLVSDPPMRALGYVAIGLQPSRAADRPADSKAPRRGTMSPPASS